MASADGVDYFEDPIFVFRLGIVHNLVKSKVSIRNGIENARTTGSHGVNVRINEANFVTKLSSRFEHSLLSVQLQKQDNL